MEKTEMSNLSKLSTPCFIFDKKEFERSISGFVAALKDFFPSYAIGYSVKTNSFPFLLEIVKKNNCLAEVVSFDEYELAILCGFNPSQIIYNGPMKSEKTFLEAISNGAVVNIETKRELEWLKNLPFNHTYNVGIRLNINISNISPEDADGDDDNSRFGFSDHTSEFFAALEFIKKLPNVNLKGLHIHRTAHSRSSRFYQRSVEYACQIISKYNLKLDYLDVGGGYFGIFPNKPTYKEYAKVIYNSLKKYNQENLTVIVEPGNALVASCFSFLSEVIDTKKVEDNTVFVTTDGSRNDIDPFFRKSDYIKDIILKDNEEKRLIIPLQIIGGCTCLEYDRLFSLTNYPELKVSDRILYNNVGAYTSTLSPLFIRFFPSVYSKLEDGSYMLVRRTWSANDFYKVR